MSKWKFTPYRTAQFICPVFLQRIEIFLFAAVVEHSENQSGQIIQQAALLQLHKAAVQTVCRLVDIFNDEDFTIQVRHKAGAAD